MSMTIGERMSFIREEFNMNQDDIAPLLGMSRSNLSGIEIGRISPSLFTVCSFCLLFDLYVDWLVLGVGDNPDLRRSYDNFIDFGHSESLGNPNKSIPEETLNFYIRGFASRLKSYRKQNNLSQKDILNKLGLAQSSYTLIEKAKSNLAADVLEKILTGLSLSGDWLLFGIESHQKNVIFPSDTLTCKNESEINRLYEARLEKETRKNEHIVYDSYIIAKEGIIPHRNLTVEQLDTVVHLIMYIQGKNDANTDVTKELELLQTLVDRFRMKSKGKNDEASQNALLKELNDYFQEK